MVKHLYQFAIHFKNGKVVRKIKKVENPFEEMLILRKRSPNIQNVVFKRI